MKRYRVISFVLANLLCIPSVVQLGQRTHFRVLRVVRYSNFWILDTAICEFGDANYQTPAGRSSLRWVASVFIPSENSHERWRCKG